ncbi:SDR family oxidoreductase [Neolewinella lacunae]|uniref:SDR family oxidoreductase n=1 Tax=Neolewinella lacunae TaxID=1517758 RepID=A0A923TAB3_9BACT|nr:SDR family oxidoreductase [Neolewinella lacunae]MBC6996354.1 SDR family oxidoreductase [Neolewinella lacunae]MDN3636977.1 SDR family oxidoreductase [Neolewinella lacunae]
MYLRNTTSVIFSASGELAAAAARGLHREGATVCLSARHPVQAQELASAVSPEYPVAAVDVLDEAAIETFLRDVRSRTGRLDLVFNGVGPSAQEAGSGTPSTALDYEQFTSGVALIVGGQFLTARTAARLWQEWGEAGTIVLLTSSMSRLKMGNMTVISAASAAVEGLARTLAAEYGRFGIRVVCVNGTAFPETETIRETTELQAQAAGIPAEAIAASMASGFSLGRGPSLKEFGDLIAFLATDAGAILNSHVIDADRGALNVI